LELTVHATYIVRLMMFRFRGSAGLSECCGIWVHMQSVGEKRNGYRCLFLWL